MSPAPETYLLARDPELARRLTSVNQTRPFWHERQLDIDTEVRGVEKDGDDSSENEDSKPEL